MTRYRFKWRNGRESNFSLTEDAFGIGRRRRMACVVLVGSQVASHPADGDQDAHPNQRLLELQSGLFPNVRHVKHPCLRHLQHFRSFQIDSVEVHKFALNELRRWISTISLTLHSTRIISRNLVQSSKDFIHGAQVATYAPS